jgi:DHA1 family inner membrane transport protein
VHTHRTGAPPARAAVLTVGTFAVGTDAFVVAGVLPDLARSLHVGVAQAAQLVTVFALAYAVLAPVLAAVTGRWPRRKLLLTALLVFVLGNVATALAPSYALVVAARLLAAAGAAMFTPNASATAAALVPPGQRARAISWVVFGLTSSTALGAPLGTFLASVLSWRETMWFVAALGGLAALVIVRGLPTPMRASSSVRPPTATARSSRSCSSSPDAPGW